MTKNRPSIKKGKNTQRRVRAHVMWQKRQKRNNNERFLLINTTRRKKGEGAQRHTGANPKCAPRSGGKCKPTSEKKREKRWKNVTTRPFCAATGPSERNPARFVVGMGWEERKIKLKKRQKSTTPDNFSTSVLFQAAPPVEPSHPSSPAHTKRFNPPQTTRLP